MDMTGPNDGLDTHVLAYRREIHAYERQRGQVADRSWRALLYIVTADPDLWARVAGRLDYVRGRADLDGLDDVSRGERLVLDVARALFREEGAVDLAAVARRLDERYFAVAMEAVRLYRESHLKGDNVWIP